MERLQAHIRIALSFSMIVMIASTRIALGQEDTVGTLVDVGTFTVTIQDLSDWTVEKDIQKGMVEFSRSKQKLLSLFSSGAGGGTSITVFKNRPSGGTPGMWLMTAQQIADNFRYSEIQGLLQDRRVKLVKLETDSVEIDGKRYYRLLYTMAMANATSESILYVYFPPEFPRTKEFFGFIMAESYVTGSIFAAKDLEQIMPLIRSLQTSGSTSTLPGPKGELLRAVSSGDSSRTKRLVESGALVNALPSDGRGPLALAALYGDESIARYLVARGATINPEGVQEIHSPLTSAILGREVRIAEFLLDKGAKANTVADTQWTPLIRAITMHLDTGFVANLLRHGADPNLGGRWTPLMHAAFEGLAPLATQLLDHGATLDMPNAQGETALILALNGNHPDVAGVLLARGANPNAAAKDGNSPLMCAARKGDSTSMARLIQLGARVNATNSWGYCPLALAAIYGHPECIQLLLNNGGAIDFATSSGATPLGFAVVNGKLDCARLLLDKGADINARTKKGWTPLMFAANNGDSTLVQLLISHGAKLDLENDDDHTALDLADDKDFTSIVAMLKKAGAKD